MTRRFVFLVLLATCVVLAARVGERYAWQLDLSAQRSNSLSPAAELALDRLGSGLDLVAFLPDYPFQRLQLARQLAPYLAHPSAPRLRYIDPLARPDLAEAEGAQRQGELHLRFAERREVVAEADSTQIDQALNRLALRGDRWIVSLTGHGERQIDDSPGGLARFAERAERLGYRVLGLDPRRIEQLPDNTAVLLIAAPRLAYDKRTTQLIDTFIDSGGRLLWLGGDAIEPLAETRFGIRHLPGIIVDADAARYGLDSPAYAIVDQVPASLVPRAPDQPATFYRATALDAMPVEPWQTTAVLRSSASSWNETGQLTGRLRRDADAGEQTGPLNVGIALQTVDGRAPPARVVYLGSAHLLSNAQIGRAANAALALGLVHWLSDNPQLLVADAAPDHHIRWSAGVGATLAVVLMGGLPLVYLGAGLWLRARRRRA